MSSADSSSIIQARCVNILANFKVMNRCHANNIMMNSRPFVKENALKPKGLIGSLSIISKACRQILVFLKTVKKLFSLVIL